MIELQYKLMQSAHPKYVKILDVYFKRATDLKGVESPVYYRDITSKLGQFVYTKIENYQLVGNMPESPLHNVPLVEILKEEYTAKRLIL